jgi:hypothetical protein
MNINLRGIFSLLVLEFQNGRGRKKCLTAGRLELRRSLTSEEEKDHCQRTPS